MIRRPAVAGMFYPADPDVLATTIDQYWPAGQVAARPAMAAVAPHAGYLYSGAVAARTISLMQPPDTVILLGPNHRGLGAPAAVFSDGAWLMPGGQVEIDAPAAAELIDACPVLEADTAAHAQEHSLEVQVPFLQRLNPKVKLVPICLARSDLGACREIGRAMAELIDRHDRRIVMLASTDMSHYEPVESARLKDTAAIERIRALDPEGLYNTVVGQGITMCGVIPTVCVLIAAQALGATKADLIQYANSGEMTGDYNQVVGYAGLIIE